MEMFWQIWRFDVHTDWSQKRKYTAVGSLILSSSAKNIRI